MRQLIVFVFFAGNLIPIPSIACSCVQVGTAQQEQAKSTVVFLGKVASIEQRSSQMDKSSLTLAWEWVAEMFGAEQSNGSKQHYRRVALEVKQTLKGNTRSNVELSTGMGGGDCGYEFEVGQGVLGLCTRHGCRANSQHLFANGSYKCAHSKMMPSAVRVYGLAIRRKRINCATGIKKVN